MLAALTPDTLWHAHANQLQQDVLRVDMLLRQVGERHPDLRASLAQVMGRLQATSAKLVQIPGEAQTRWQALSGVHYECRDLFGLTLEILGGLALRHGIEPGKPALDAGSAARAESWLQRLHDRLKLPRKPVVIPGRGALLVAAQAELNIVRTPFLDHDLWSLPLLGRVTGLWEAADDPTQQLSQTITRLVNKEPQPGIRQPYFVNLFADMFATAILGPVYALAVFVLELDYASPQHYGLEEQSPIDREVKPGILPTPSERAAAILAMLKLMNQRTEDDYTRVIKYLEALWQATLATMGQPEAIAALATDQEFHRNQHQQLYAFIYDNFPEPLAITLQTWRRAKAWFEFLSDPEQPMPEFPLSQIPDYETALLGAIWLHRLHYPANAENVHAMALKLLNGETEITTFSGPKGALSTLVVQVRLERLRKHGLQLENTIKRQIDAEDRKAVAGRFYQLISHQWYAVDLCREQLDAGNDKETPSSLATAETRTDTLQRAAIEFLGGLLISNQDRDPRSTLSVASQPALPSICLLADRLLHEYAQRTGVNWNARTVFGPDSFLEHDTGVIRVRFPDWSLWSLPVMAHEFGHVVARVTPQLPGYQSKAVKDALEKKLDSTFVASHLEELFCDIFATYTLGPAFVCSAIMLQFRPYGALLPHGSHPSYQERVEIMLQTLDVMSLKTQDRVYEPIVAALRRLWGETVSLCESGSTNQAFRHRLDSFIKPWSAVLAVLIDQSFRMGARYTADRWRLAQELALCLTNPQTSASQRREIALTHTLTDLLNALWWARIRLTDRPYQVDELTWISYELGTIILE